MASGEIVLPETKPEMEWVRGRPLRKVSPTRDHSRVQTTLASLLDAWSERRGEVGTEWRFRIALPDDVRRPLVPDIAFVAKDKLRGRSIAELQSPPFAPTVAIEVLSPDDVPVDVAEKIDVYLRGGSELVIVVDPASRSMVLHDGGLPHELAGDATLQHPALPQFRLPLGRFFAKALDLREW